MWTRQALQALIDERLRGYRFILVSNREPYLHRYELDHVECVQPASGLATALEPIMRACGGVWIANGSGDADRAMVDAQNRIPLPPGEPRFTLRRVWLTQQEERLYYDGLANQGLWPLCHIVFTRPVFNPEEWRAYREVNDIFARAVLEEAGDAPTFVFIQDYHFALLPRLVKQKNPNLIVAQFWHIPWPNPEVFRIFPWKEELLDGMLGNDLLGFHLRFHCQNFVDTVDSMLEAKVDRERFEITRGGKTTTVQPFPISIDFEDQMTVAQKPLAQQEMAHWRWELGLRDEYIGIGIDRIDYTKGICERLRALDRFLGGNRGYRGRVVFVQIAVPSRTRIQQYNRLAEDIRSLVDEINRKWSIGECRPVILIEQHVPRLRLTALHLLADFCIVSPLHDGMNLVAKEYVASRCDDNGVLILSDFAGASRELTEAIVVNPFHEDELSKAILQALEMPPEERTRRMRKMRAVVAENNIYRWAAKIILDLSPKSLLKNRDLHVLQASSDAIAG
jgi:alpha,alpha-trehalose-phosphate synthase [UDP-forming]